jgi:hypothetical protein
MIVMEQLSIQNYSPSMSDDIRALLAALLLAKTKFIATGLNGFNNHTKSSYALLTDIYKSVEAALLENKIIIIHFNRPADTGFEYVHTRLIHETGQFIEDCRIQESEKPGNQGKGTANTYMKKYAVLSLCAIAPSEGDDDGQEEQKDIEKKSKGPELLVAEEIAYLTQQLKASVNGKTLYANILKDNNIRSLSDLPFSRYEAVKSYIANSKE